MLFSAGPPRAYTLNVGTPLPKVYHGGQFADSLNSVLTSTLEYFFLPTCVGLRYGRVQTPERGIFLARDQPLSEVHKDPSIHGLALMTSGFGLPVSLYPVKTPPSEGLVYPGAPPRSNVCYGSGIFNPGMSIDYASASP